MRIRLGHSPDPDDAFMFHALAAGKIDTGEYEFEHVLEGIQTLNERAMRGELEITALSVHAYAYVRDQYVLTRCGGSFGQYYGPMIVAKEVFNAVELPYKTIAVPGELTTAFLLLRMICLDPQYVVYPFDEIIQAIAAGKADAGLIIHEGQLTYAREGLACVLDLGKWWAELTRLPLPLGANAVRRNLGPKVCRELADILLQSIQYALDHREDALRHAMQYGRDLDEDLTDKFVGMYVNELTLDAGPSGMKAIDELLRRGAELKIIPDARPVEFV